MADAGVKKLHNGKSQVAWLGSYLNCHQSCSSLGSATFPTAHGSVFALAKPFSSLGRTISTGLKNCFSKATTEQL
jgi:hypothetical protein